LDWVLVLDDGRVVEEGAPKELKTKSETFSSLYKKQKLEDEMKELELVK
jgi:ABC-type multidrug transport system fused ATPase/permease subunit